MARDRPIVIEKHQDYTPFAYTYNNPIRYADLFGLDTLVFNQKGFYSHSIQSKVNTVLLVLGENENQVYNFNDPKRDVKYLEKAISKYGSGTQLLFTMNNNDIEEEIESSGANLNANQDNKWTFAFKESLSMGTLDFWSSSLIPQMRAAGINQSDIEIGSRRKNVDRPGFYIFSGHDVIYNDMDAGNFLWGAAMQRLGFSPGIPQLGAHFHQHFIQ